MKKKTLLAHWCYCSNFGDALNPYILKKLTDMNVKYCNTTKPNLKQEIRSMLGCFRHLKKYDFSRMCQPVLNTPVILAVGSIMSRSHCNYLIWGAGYMDKKEVSGG